MKNLKKYTAPEAQTINIGMTSMCCTSVNNETPADPKQAVMSKGIDEWSFEEDEE